MAPDSSSGHRVGLARHAVELAEHAFEDQRQAESQQQAVQRIEPVQPLEKSALDDHAQHAHDERRQDQRDPVVDAELVQHDPGGEGAQHVQRAVREVHDVQQAEDHGQPQAEHGVERAVDQAQHELARERPGWGMPKISIMDTVNGEAGLARGRLLRSLSSLLTSS